MDRLDITEGDTVELERVLLIGDEDGVTVGEPIIEGAKVVATSRGEGRAKKIIVFKYKPKVRYRKKTGHRQYYTSLAIDEVIKPGTAKGGSASKGRQRKKEVIESGA